MNKKTVISILIPALAFAVTLSCYSLGVFEKPEFLLYDAKAKLFRSDKMPPITIKTILVDEASLKALEDVAGRWPWPRAIWADLLEFLSLGGAKAVLFDVLFTERYDEKNDRALAAATRTSRNVYHSMMITRAEPDPGKKGAVGFGKPLPPDFASRFAVKKLTGGAAVKPGRENNEYALPIGPLHTVSKGVAVVEFPPDSDGVLRRTKPLREYQGKYFPVLGLAPFIGDTSAVVLREGSLSINDRTIPLDRDGNYFINMYDVKNVAPFSMSGIFASLQKIKQGEVEDLVVNPGEFKDAIVFVGSSAAATHDVKTTPLGQNVPGVIFHVALASNYLLNDFLTPPDRRLTLFSALLGAFLSSLVIFFSKRFFIRAAFPVLLLSVYAGLVLYAFTSNVLVEAVPFVFSTVSSSFLSFGYLTFTEGAEKRRVSHLFTQYVSKDVLNEVLHNYKEYVKSSAGQKVELTVLFSDIRSFTTMSETTPPEKIVEMLNVHFTAMADIILKHNGTIDKYIGDAIMAFWGAPVRTNNHAEQAVLAGIEMLEALKEVNKTLSERGFLHEVKIGVGINTGVATIGNIGSELKKNYTVVGDTVNLASRLESITKEHKTPLIFSEYTYEKIKDKIDCTLIGNVKVKGREQAVSIYTAEHGTGS
jgi:adenylate cyclase